MEHDTSTVNVIFHGLMILYAGQCRTCGSKNCNESRGFTNNFSEPERQLEQERRH